MLTEVEKKLIVDNCNSCNDTKLANEILAIRRRLGEPTNIALATLRNQISKYIKSNFLREKKETQKSGKRPVKTAATATSNEAHASIKDLLMSLDGDESSDFWSEVLTDFLKK